MKKVCDVEMPMNLLLDTMILGDLCHPKLDISQPAWQWVSGILDVGDDYVFLSELCDYEIRRKILHLINQGQKTHKSIKRLDDLAATLEYLPITTPVMRKASEFWAESRSRGQPTSSELALDGDVILAAQAALIGATIVTSNRKHLSQFVPAWDRTDFWWSYAFVCVRGAVDNIAFEWDNHFVVTDSLGRRWHCRQEAHVSNRNEEGESPIVTNLRNDCDNVQQMSASHSKVAGEDSGTTVISHVFVGPSPQAQSDLLRELAITLGRTAD